MISAACPGNYTPRLGPDEDPPPFEEEDTIMTLREKYRVHVETTVVVDVLLLHKWRFFRRPHTKVVKALAAVMKVFVLHSP